MWSVTPSEAIPHELDVTRPNAKSRAHLDMEHDAEERRHRRRNRRRENLDKGVEEIDTFERAADSD